MLYYSSYYIAPGKTEKSRRDPPRTRAFLRKLEILTPVGKHGIIHSVIQQVLYDKMRRVW